MSASGFDVTAFRTQFPSLASGIAHFDGPGGTQTPYAVGAAIAATLTGPLSNRGTTGLSETNADAAVMQFRAAYADFLGVPKRGVVYGRSATELTYHFARTLSAVWRPGDEVVVSRLDHDANVRPWLQVAARAGVLVRWLDFDPATSEILWESVESAIGERTRLVAITGASNLIGTIPAVAAIAAKAHAVGALVWVDGVHVSAHRFTDVGALGADFFVCSPYKFLGPHCAVVGADPVLLESLTPDKLLPSTDAVPERFELGTLPYELLAGATAAVDVLASAAGGAGVSAGSRRARLAESWTAIHDHETAMTKMIEAGLADLGDRVAVHSRAAERTPTLLVTFPGRASWDAYQFLSARGIQAPAGSFYAYEPFRRLGLADTHALRIGVAPYTDDSDVSRLLDGLRAFVES